jgi:hypothetical protein
VSTGFSSTTPHRITKSPAPTAFAKKFKAGDTEYDINRSFFHRCLHEDENGDPNNIERGSLKGPLLLKVPDPHSELSAGALDQTFKHIFTSLSSVDTTDDVEPVEKRRRIQPSQLRTVANILGMDIQVTPRALTYAVVRVCTPFYQRMWALT